MDATELGDVMRWVERFWPVAAILAGVLVVQAVWSSRFDVTGHAAEHLSSATSLFGIAFLLGTLVWAVDPGTRHRPLLWILTGLVLAGAAVVAGANVRVVTIIGGEDWSFEQAEQLGPSREGFTEWHDVAQVAAWATVVASILLAGWLWRRRVVTGWVALAAVALSVLIPSWIFPGAGILVLAVVLVVDQVIDERAIAARTRPAG